MPILISRYTEGRRTFLLRWIGAGHGCESSEAKTGDEVDEGTLATGIQVRQV